MVCIDALPQCYCCARRIRQAQGRRDEALKAYEASLQTAERS
jgi:hypothetical protein